MRKLFPHKKYIPLWDSGLIFYRAFRSSPSKQLLEPPLMQMPLYRDEIAGEVHDFFRQIPIYHSTSPSADWPHLPQAWPGMNNCEDELQLGCNVPCMPEASTFRNWIGNRSDNVESSSHLNSGGHPRLSSQTSTDNASHRMTQSFLSAGQQSMESQKFPHTKGSNFQNGQSSIFPTVIRSQPRNQPLDFEGLFVGSTNQFETGNASSGEKEQLNESNCIGQNVLYNHVQNAKLACQNSESMPQGQPTQSYNHLGGQAPQLANIQGCFGQQPGIDAAGYILYQQHIQEMHRQQQILQLQRHFQLSRQQQLQWFLAAQNQGFGTQILQDSGLLKSGSERLPFSYQSQFNLPQNPSGNVLWPLVSSTLRPGEVNNYPLGPGIPVQQQLAPKAPTVNSPYANYAANYRRNDCSLVPENSLSNSQVSDGIGYHYTGSEKDATNRNSGPPTFPGMSLDRDGYCNNLQTDKLQQLNKFLCRQNIQETYSETIPNSMNSYYEEQFQPSALLSNYSAQQQPNWAGISDHEESVSMLGSNIDEQEICETVNSPQEATDLQFRDQSAGIHQHLQLGRSYLTQAGLNMESLERDVTRGAQVMQQQSLLNNELVNNAPLEAQSSWSKLHLQNMQFQFENLHQRGPDIKQGVWNDTSLHNDGTPLPGNTLHLFNDFDSVDKTNSDLLHNVQAVRTSGLEHQFSECRPPEEQISVQGQSSFLPLADSDERLHGNWKTYGLQQENVHPGNSLQALLELEDDIDDDLSDQQVLQQALQIDGSFQLSEMEWQRQIHAGELKLHHDELHSQATFASSQSMSTKLGGDPGSTRLCGIVASQFQNEDCSTPASISQRRAEGKKESTHIFQGVDGIPDETFNLPTDMVAKEIKGRLEGHVWEDGSIMGSSHKAFGVVRSREMMQSTQSNVFMGNSGFSNQELASNHLSGQQVLSMQKFAPESWRIPSGNAIDKTYEMIRTDSSTISSVAHGRNDLSFSQPYPQDGREKLTNISYSLEENLQKDKYCGSLIESNAMLQSRLESKNLSGSSPPRSALPSRNLIPSWYNPKDAPAENMNFKIVTHSQTKVQQLPAQQNGQKSITGKDVHIAGKVSRNKDVTSSVRTETMPKANSFQFFHGNDSNGTVSPADSLGCEGSPNTTNFSSYSSASRNTLQLLNRNEMSEGLTLEVKQHLNTSAFPTESGQIGNCALSSGSFQLQPVSPQHFGLRLAPPSHMVPSTINGRSSLTLSHADDAKVWLGNGSRGHGLQIPVQTSASETREMRLAQKDFTVVTSIEDKTLVVHQTSGPIVQSPVVTNDAQNRLLSSANYGVQISSATAACPLPQASSSNLSSFNFTSERRFADESIFLDRAAESSSSLESNLVPSSVPLSVASQGCLQNSSFQTSFRAPLHIRVAKSQHNSAQDNSNQPTSTFDILNNSESSVYLDLKKNSPCQPMLVGHPSRLDRKSENNISADFKDKDYTGTVAQDTAREEVIPLVSHGHSVASAMQRNNSSAQFHQSETLTERSPHISEKDSAVQFNSYVDSMEKQQSGGSANLEKEKSQSGCLEGQCSLLNNSSEHTSFQCGLEVQDSRPQADMIKNVTINSVLTSSQRQQPGPTMFSDQHLVTDALVHRKVGSQTHSHLPSYSFPKALYEFSQGYSQRNMHSEGVLPSGYVEKSQPSNLIMQQTRTSKFSFAGPKHNAEQTGVMLVPSESAHHHLSSTTKVLNTIASAQVNTVEPSAHLQGSVPKPAKTISGLPMKRRKECPPLMPWHMVVTQSAASLPTTSGAELQWAAAFNRLPDKGDDGVDLHDTNMQYINHAKRRLRLSTQLMQMIIPPAPIALMRNTVVEGRELGTFAVTKVVLGEACSLAGGGDRQDESPAKKDIDRGHIALNLASKQQKVLAGTKFRAEVAEKDMVEFKERAKRLNDCLSRLESLPSGFEIMTKVQHLDKLCITNRLVDRHLVGLALEEMDLSSGGRATSANTQVTCKVFPRRYVRAVPMPSRLPEETNLVSL